MLGRAGRACFVCVSAAAAPAAACTLLPRRRRRRRAAAGRSFLFFAGRVAGPRPRADARAAEATAPPLWRRRSPTRAGSRSRRPRAGARTPRRLARVPLVAAALLPGGAAGAGLLLSAAGAAAPSARRRLIVDVVRPAVGDEAQASSLSSLGASTGSARAHPPATGALAGGALALVALALAAAPPAGGGAGARLGGDGGARARVALVLVWSPAAAARGARARRGARGLARGPRGGAIALPRAVGDGVGILAPIALGAVAAAAPAAGAGFHRGRVGPLGAAGLAALTDGGPRDAKGE